MSDPNISLTPENAEDLAEEREARAARGVRAQGATTPGASGSVRSRTGERRSEPRKTERVTVRMPSDTAQRVSYWSQKHGLQYDNDYVLEAIEEKIRRENGDYDLPTLEQARIAQLQDELKSLSVTVNQLSSIVTAGFDGLLRITRGDAFLQDQDSGELDS